MSAAARGNPAGAQSHPLSADDERWLRRTLTLARRGRYRTSPNPMVGAVITRDGGVVAEGHHRRVGAAHGEIDALAALERAGMSPQGATVYVNLEPCAHHGRTGPCADALVAAGVRRVVCCHRDPNPLVAGAGIARLRDAGIEVAIGGPVAAATRLNAAYLTAAVEQRPLVTLKWAMSLDGKIATASGESQWISSPAGRRWALRLRERHDAILVGSGTVLADDPRLDRRLGLASGAIVRVVLDRRLRLNAGARLFGVPGDALVFTERHAPRKRAQLEAAGATVVELARVAPGPVLRQLHERGVHSLLVEGGGSMLAAFAAEGHFDRVAVCCAPRLIGGARALGPVAGVGVERLDATPWLELERTQRVGSDLVLHYWQRGRLDRLRAAVDGDRRP